MVEVCAQLPPLIRLPKMYKLTEQRLSTAETILDKYRELLLTRKQFNCNLFETELRSAWDLGYHEIKDILLDICKRFEKYRLVALYYMENQNPSGAVSEFQTALATAYGTRDWHSTTAKEKADFWSNALSQTN